MPPAADQPQARAASQRAGVCRLVMAVVPLFAACGGDRHAAPVPGADASIVDRTSPEAASIDEPVEEPIDEPDAGAESASTDDVMLDAAVDPDGEASIDAIDAEPYADVAAEPPPPPDAYQRPSYQHLVETGLFENISTLAVAADAQPFEPTYRLWSDGADKRRWVRLPPGTQIDTSDMDHWVFPIGTKLWKEFSLGGVLLETRLIERYGTGADDYWMGAFVWNVEGTDAVLAPDGQKDINGTAHDAPAQMDCGACHRGDVGRVLGLSAIQMSRDSRSPNLRDLAARGWLSVPPAGGEDYPVSGDPTTASALGYLHANCGHCHNQNGTAWPDTQMVLRLRIADREAGTSGVFDSVVGKNVTYWRGGPITLRVAPGQPDTSALIVRMEARGSKDQMPPLATEISDGDGIELVRSWIAGLSP